MAAGEDGEHTRFPCLAMVRYAVATVVTVLAAAVVVMAIHAVLRSEDVHLSIDYGYIEADGLRSVTIDADDLPVFDVGNGSEYRIHPWLNLRVILSAYNPGGRTKIDCNKTTIRVLDMQNAYQEIVQFEPINFTVPQQTAHTQTNRVEVSNNKTVLAYINEQYHGEASFSVMVQVDAIITSYPLGRKTNSNSQTYFCWPVTVGLIAYGTLPDNVACKTREETQLPANVGPRVGPLLRGPR